MDPALSPGGDRRRHRLHGGPRRGALARGDTSSPLRVEFDRYSLRVDGRRVIVRAGSLHYFRLPARALWRDRIAQMRDAGLNAVDVYYPWNFHSERPGEFDFADLRDVEHLHDLIEARGPVPDRAARARTSARRSTSAACPPSCCAIRVGRAALPHAARASSYSRAYMDGGARAGSARSCRASRRARTCCCSRSRTSTRVPAPVGALLSSRLADLAIRWLGASSAGAARELAVAAPARARRRRESRRGGELGQHNAYMRELYQLARKLGVRVPIFHNDVPPLRGPPARRRPARARPLPDHRRSGATGATTRAPSTSSRATRPRSTRTGAAQNPVFYPELQGGWYDGWGGVGYARMREQLGADAHRRHDQGRARRARARSGTTTCSAAARPGATWRAPTCTAPTTTARRSASPARPTRATTPCAG